MKTVGQLLRETREAKNLSIEEVAKATKIQKKYLLAVEADDFKQIPSQAYASGFVKNYSEFLSLNSRHIMAFFRRQTREVSKTSLLPQKEQTPLRKSLYTLTPSRFIMLLVTVLLLLFVGYFSLQYIQLQQPPMLTIQNPKESEIIVESQRVDILGQTEPDATVSINGIGVLVRADGKFFDQIQIFPGDNTVTITATSRYGKTTTLTRLVKVPTQENTSEN